MNAENREKRLENIRKCLKPGDGRRIARLAGVHPVWVSNVMTGRGVSERVLTIAEQIIAARQASKPLCSKCGCVIEGAHYNTPIGCYCITCWKQVPVSKRRELQREYEEQLMNSGSLFA